MFVVVVIVRFGGVSVGSHRAPASRICPPESASSTPERLADVAAGLDTRGDRKHGARPVRDVLVQRIVRGQTLLERHELVPGVAPVRDDEQRVNAWNAVNGSSAQICTPTSRVPVRRPSVSHRCWVQRPYV